jgi:hypothetical protein
MHLCCRGVPTVLFTAAAPHEALPQRFGRSNRLAARPANSRRDPPSRTSRRRVTDFHGHDDSAVDERDATGWLNYFYATA